MKIDRLCDILLALIVFALIGTCAGRLYLWGVAGGISQYSAPQTPMVRSYR